jgi:hypothetical protein
VVSRALEVTAYAAEVHFGELREDTSALCDYTSELDECVQVNLTEITELVFHREVANTDKYGLMDVAIVGVHLEDGVIGDFVQNREHDCGLFGQPDGERWLSAGQVPEVNFD